MEIQGLRMPLFYATLANSLCQQKSHSLWDQTIHILLFAIDLSIHREGERLRGREENRGRIHFVDNHGP